MLRFEPFVLHAECRDMESARLLLTAARYGGFRESGITVGERGSRVMVRIQMGITCGEGDGDGGS